VVCRHVTDVAADVPKGEGQVPGIRAFECGSEAEIVWRNRRKLSKAVFREPQAGPGVGLLRVLRLPAFRGGEEQRLERLQPVECYQAEGNRDVGFVSLQNQPAGPVGDSNQHAQERKLVRGRFGIVDDDVPQQG
jgi:hypothetical protein